MIMKAFIDGSSMGNPGESGYGIVLKTEKGETIKEIGKYIGHATNNVAEYAGLLGCLKMVQQYGGSSLIVYSDSQLLVYQMKGIYRVKKSHLAKLHAEAMSMLEKSQILLDIRYIPTEKNREADQLARRAVMLKSDILI